MFHRELRVPLRNFATVCVLDLAISAFGCTSRSDRPLPSAVESAEVHCDACGKKVARQSAESHISPEGLDVYVCKSCLSRPAQGKSRSSPPARTSTRPFSKGTT
jgi:hypothetical protein